MSWDYDKPDNLWESWPWWLRWPVAIAASLWLITALLLPIIIMFK